MLEREAHGILGDFGMGKFEISPNRAKGPLEQGAHLLEGVLNVGKQVSSFDSSFPPACFLLLRVA